MSEQSGISCEILVYPRATPYHRADGETQACPRTARGSAKPRRDSDDFRRQQPVDFGIGADVDYVRGVQTGLAGRVHLG
jgi:hypothetical protein